MFGQAPLTRSYGLAYAYDPAFEIDRYGPLEDEEAQRKYLDDYDRCVETLDFQPLCIPGQTPTIFQFRTLKPSELDRMMSLSGEVGSATWLAFRLALVSVENAHPDFTKFDRQLDPALREYGQIVSRKAMETFGAMSLLAHRPTNELVYGLGGLVIARSTKPSPP